MLSFESIGPETLETFTDHADNGGHGGPAEPRRVAENDRRTDRNLRDGSDYWEERKDLAEQRIRVRRGSEVDEKKWLKHSDLANQGS